MKDKKSNRNPSSYLLLIEKFRINKTFLANQMKMPKGTFNNKLRAGLEPYHFTEQEEIRLKTILKNMGEEICENLS